MAAATPGYAQYEGLGQDINLPGLPTGGQGIDAQYLADAAMLRHNISNQYADILQQLGYTDPQGNFVMGDVESQGIHDKAEADYQRQLAVQHNDQAMQQAGTLFSGYRGTTQAQAEHPYVQQIADINVAVPKQLAHLFEQASGLVNDYVLQNNQALAASAMRIAQGLSSSVFPGGGGGGGSSTSTGTSIPPPTSGTTTVTSLTPGTPVFNPVPVIKPPANISDVGPQFSKPIPLT